MAHFQVRKLFLLVASWNILMPRVSSLADEVSVVFQGIDNATTLLLSDDGATLYVGARDEVLSLDVSQPGVMTVKRKTVWPPGPENINQCTERGKNEKVDCPNYIRVLQFLNGTHLYACGSHAFKPHSRLFDRETLEFLGSPKEVRGHCPFNPLKRSAAITVDGELYTATTSDYLEKKPSISRYLSKGRNDMTLDSHMSVLEEPTFIKSFFVPSERKVYFFFSEVGKEYTFTEKLTVSRVAQVCTDDVGGEYMLQKRWTTFAKAPLVCQPQRQLPFTVMQDIVALPPPENERADNTLFYGVFSSQWPSAAAASVVCAFQLSDVNAVFSGNYKTYKTETNQWLPQTDKALNIGKCGLLHENGKKLEYVRKTFLTDGKVQAVNRRLALVSADEDYCRIAVQRTKAANGRAYTVLFLLTESGFLHKAVLLGTGHRIIDKTQVFTPPQVMKSLLLSTAKGVVFVGSSEGVTQVPVSCCSNYSTCQVCVSKQDPFCAWDTSRGICASVSTIVSDSRQDVEYGNVTEKCGDFREPVHRSSKPSPDKVVYQHLNRMMMLKCPKTSDEDHVSWKFSNNTPLPHGIFFQTLEGYLIFSASPATIGSYHCITAEGPNPEQITAVFHVQLAASPRMLQEDFKTTWTTLGGKTSVDSGLNATYEITAEKEMEEQAAKHTVNSQPHAKVEERCNHPVAQSKNYYGELVAVSFLMVICLILLGALYWWHQRSIGKSFPKIMFRKQSQIEETLEKDLSIGTTGHSAC